MRRSILAAVCATALAATGFAVAAGSGAFADEPEAAEPNVAAEDAPTADELREAVADCDTQVSDGMYAERSGQTRDIPVCDTGNAIHWTSGMTIDCDGQPTDNCNTSTDPHFQPQTTCTQSDGDYLIADQLPYVVVPMASDTWDYRHSSIGCGTPVAVVYEDTVVYAAVGDAGPADAIGEGSYALADQLGIDPDPATGGVSGKVVDYIVFPDEMTMPIEDPEESIERGQAAGNRLLDGCEGYGFDEYPELTQGADGAEVNAAQCRLAELGFPAGDDMPTGEFDEATAAAVSEFQDDVGLDATGDVDSHTWTALVSAGETPTLQNGSRDNGVVRLQQALTAALGETIAQDGLYGSGTQQAVSDYQSAVGLEPDGSVGEETWEELQAGS